MGLAFVVTGSLQDLGVEVMVRCDLWDQAKGEQCDIEGIQYQRSLRDTGSFQRFLPDYTHILQLLEEEFLRQPEIASVVQEIIKNRDTLGKHLMPSTGMLAMRASCPT